jgi:hypothetical protein
MLHDAAHALLLELGLLPAACGVTELGPGGLLRFDCSALQPRLIRWMRPQALRGAAAAGHRAGRPAPRRPAGRVARGAAGAHLVGPSPTGADNQPPPLRGWIC